MKKLDENPNLFNKPIRSQLKDRINNGDLSSVDVWDEFSELYFVDSPCEENGFMFFSESKLVQVFKFFCSKSEVSKTKLMKLLYYADHNIIRIMEFQSPVQLMHMHLLDPFSTVLKPGYISSLSGNLR